GPEWARRASVRKCAQSEPAAVAGAASQLFLLIARPGQVQRRAQLQPAPDDLALFHLNDRRYDCNPCFWPRSRANELLKHAVIFRPAIWIAGAVFRYRANKNGAGPNHFRPAHGHGKKMRIAKRNVGRSNRAAVRSWRAQ